MNDPLPDQGLYEFHLSMLLRYRMKKILVTLFIVLVSTSLFSQELKSLVYDKKGRLIQRNRVNYFGKLEQDMYGIAMVKYEYDRKGNLVRKSYFDKYNNPYSPDTLRQDLPIFPSYTAYAYMDDKLVEITNRHTNGALMDLNAQPAVRIMRYNNKGQKVEEITYDKKGKVVGMGGLDIAIQRFKYNLKNQLIEERSYDKDNKLLDFGMNIAQHTYDAQGRKKRTDYFFANSSLYHSDLFFYNTQGQLIKEESYNKYGKLEYTILFTYDGSQLYKREFKYPDKSIVQKHGFDLNIPGWKIISSPKLDIKDVDGTGSFLITLDDKGNIIEIKNSSCKVPLAYSLYPYLKQLKFAKDETADEPGHKGELKVGVLNINSVEEF